MFLLRKNPKEEPLIDGYPAANFTLSANISLNVKIFGDILYNAPQPETQPESLGSGQFVFQRKEITLKRHRIPKQNRKTCMAFHRYNPHPIPV